MKKILTVALVALLAAGTAFAGFSGNANIKLGFDFTSGDYGFKNGNDVNFDLDLATADADKKGEGDIYAGVKASFAIKAGNLKSDTDYVKHGYGLPLFPASDSDGYAKAGIAAFFKVAEAYVAGQDWKVSITGTQGAPDFAKSAVDTKKDAVKDIFGNAYDTKNTAVTYKVASNKAAGVTVDFKGFKGSVGLSGKGKVVDFNAFVQTPEIALADAVKVQVAGIASQLATDADAAKNYLAFGASGKVSFVADAVKGSVAADFGAKKAGNADKYALGVDVAANLAISPVALDIYYANDVETKAKIKTTDTAENTKNLLSAQVKVDLKDFDVPVALTVTGKDLINKQDLSAKAEVALDAAKITVSGGYKVNGKVLKAGLSGEYAAEVATFKAGINYETTIGANNKNRLYGTASVESAALVPGATLSLKYDVDSAENDMNWLADQTTTQNFGAVTAQCKISF